MSEVDYEEDVPSSSPNADASTEEVYTIHVSNLSYRVTEETLHSVFSSFGSIANEIVVKEPLPPHRSRGFGFVSFRKESAADEALSVMNGKEFEGRAIKIERSKRTTGYAKSPGVYLGHKGRLDNRRDNNRPRGENGGPRRFHDDGRRDDFRDGGRRRDDGPPRDFRDDRRRDGPGPPRDYRDDRRRDGPGPPRDFRDGGRRRDDGAPRDYRDDRRRDDGPPRDYRDDRRRDDGPPRDYRDDRSQEFRDDRGRRDRSRSRDNRR